MTDPVTALFGARVLRERTARRWSTRELAAKAAVGVSTVNRAENGRGDTWLTNAVRIAAALGVPLGDLVSTPVCPACDGMPPDGFTCNQCGRGNA